LDGARRDDHRAIDRRPANHRRAGETGYPNKEGPTGAEAVSQPPGEKGAEDPERVALINRPVGEAAMRTILERAAARGEINLDQVTPRIAALPVDLLRHEIFVGSASVPDAVILEIVDEVFLPLAYRNSANAGHRRSRPHPMPRGGSRSAG
jgi:Tetracyclin repressor-like, C-terminal domain